MIVEASAWEHTRIQREQFVLIKWITLRLLVHSPRKAKSPDEPT